MLILQRPEISQEDLGKSRANFIIEPLEPGFGLTLKEIFQKKNITPKNIFILGAGGVTSSIICAFEKLKTKIFYLFYHFSYHQSMTAKLH